MKIITIYILLLGYIGVCNGQTLSEKSFVGTWKFIELQDENGEKQTKIPLIRFGKYRGIENVNRDSYTFNADGTYISENPHNVSTGTWYFDKETNEINLELLIEKTNRFFKDLKKKKIIVKRDDGRYFQKPVKKKVIDFSANDMIIADRAPYILIYKKVK